MEPARNRKQRRAAAAAQKDANAFDPASIPMAHPPRNPSPKTDAKGRTLVDIISERQGDLMKQAEAGAGPGAAETQFVTIDPATGEISGFEGSGVEAIPVGDKSTMEDQINGQTQPEKGEEDNSDGSIPPLIDTVLLSMPLTTLHLTLAYLAAHQYAETINLEKLLRESFFVSFPVLSLIIHLAHGHVISFNRGGTKQSDTLSLFPWSRDKLSLGFLRRLIFPPTFKTSFFLSLAVFLGTKLMTITNEEPYYAVMKRAPAIGTLWVWSILEIPVGAAMLGALGPLVWGLWWKGYGIF